jgi:hypothetical protein
MHGKGWSGNRWAIGAGPNRRKSLRPMMRCSVQWTAGGTCPTPGTLTHPARRRWQQRSAHRWAVVTDTLKRSAARRSRQPVIHGATGQTHPPRQVSEALAQDLRTSDWRRAPQIGPPFTQAPCSRPVRPVTNIRDQYS